MVASVSAGRAVAIKLPGPEVSKTICRRNMCMSMWGFQKLRGPCLGAHTTIPIHTLGISLIAASGSASQGC